MPDFAVRNIFASLCLYESLFPELQSESSGYFCGGLQHCSKDLSIPHSRSLVTPELFALWFQSPLTEAEQWPVHILFFFSDYFPGISFFLFLISSSLCCICPCVTPAQQTPLLKKGEALCVRVCHLDPSSVKALISFFTQCVSKL